MNLFFSYKNVNKQLSFEQMFIFGYLFRRANCIFLLICKKIQKKKFSKKKICHEKYISSNSSGDNNKYSFTTDYFFFILQTFFRKYDFCSRVRLKNYISNFFFKENFMKINLIYCV